MSDDYEDELSEDGREVVARLTSMLAPLDWPERFELLDEALWQFMRGFLDTGPAPDLADMTCLLNTIVLRRLPPAPIGSLEQATFYLFTVDETLAAHGERWLHQRHPVLAPLGVQDRGDPDWLELRLAVPQVFSVDPEEWPGLALLIERSMAEEEDDGTS